MVPDFWALPLELTKHIPDIQVAQMLDIDGVRIQQWRDEGRLREAPFAIREHLLLGVPWHGLEFDG
jgi:hypothetical protein